MRAVLLLGIFALAFAIDVASLRVPALDPPWLDLVRIEVLIIGGLGLPASFVVGPGLPRATLGAIMLVLAMLVQFLVAASLAAEPCWAPLPNIEVPILLARGVIVRWPAVPVLIPIVAVPFSFLVLSRRPLAARLGLIAASLLVVAAVTGIVVYTGMNPADRRCMDF